MTASNGIKRAQGTEVDGTTLCVDNNQSKFSLPHHSCIPLWLYYKQPHWTIEYKTLFYRLSPLTGFDQYMNLMLEEAWKIY